MTHSLWRFMLLLLLLVWWWWLYRCCHCCFLFVICLCFPARIVFILPSATFWTSRDDSFSFPPTLRHMPCSSWLFAFCLLVLILFTKQFITHTRLPSPPPPSPPPTSSCPVLWLVSNPLRKKVIWRFCWWDLWRQRYTGKSGTRFRCVSIRRPVDTHNIVSYHCKYQIDIYRRYIDKSLSHEAMYQYIIRRCLRVCFRSINVSATHIPTALTRVRTRWVNVQQCQDIARE